MWFSLFNPDFYGLRSLALLSFSRAVIFKRRLSKNSDTDVRQASANVALIFAELCDLLFLMTVNSDFYCLTSLTILPTDL